VRSDLTYRTPQQTLATDVKKSVVLEKLLQNLGKDSDRFRHRRELYEIDHVQLATYFDKEGTWTYICVAEADPEVALADVHHIIRCSKEPARADKNVFLGERLPELHLEGVFVTVLESGDRVKVHLKLVKFRDQRRTRLYGKKWFVPRGTCLMWEGLG
jgi:hypothetical protein